MYNEPENNEIKNKTKSQGQTDGRTNEQADRQKVDLNHYSRKTFIYVCNVF